MFTPRIIRKIAKANLIGRGCNSFPTAKKWQLVRHAPDKEKYVICNCSESEPGLFKDKYILDNFAGKVIEGIEIAMETLKATKGFIYLNPEYYSSLARILNGLIKGKKSNIELYQKPLHDYVGGEETSILNSMEGKRVEPRLKPPFPTTHGFYNAPTLINNCETFYAVSQIKHNEYHQTRFYCYSEFINGQYKNQKILELPVNITIKKTLQEFKHQPSKEYFYQISGGASGTCYNHQQLNHPFEGLASIIVYKTPIGEKDIIMHWANFFENESCGQCVTCREGTYRLRELLENHYFSVNSRQAKRDDPRESALFNDLVHSLQNTSFCPLGKVSVNAILSYWKNIKKCDIK